jgi:hypothetical protein
LDALPSCRGLIGEVRNELLRGLGGIGDKYHEKRGCGGWQPQEAFGIDTWIDWPADPVQSITMGRRLILGIL